MGGTPNYMPGMWSKEGCIAAAASIGDGTFPVDVFAGLTVKPADHACITSLADSGVLQSMLKMLSCCINDANAASQCAVTPDDPGCSSQASTKFPTSARVHKCQEMFDLAELHTCGQAAVDWTDQSALKDATSHGVRCIATAQWEDNDVERSMQLAAPCDTARNKLCFQGCTFPQMDDILSSGALRPLVDQCSREMNFPAPSVSFVKTSCDKASQWAGDSIPYYCLALSIILIVLSLLLVKVW